MVKITDPKLLDILSHLKKLVATGQDEHAYNILTGLTEPSQLPDAEQMPTQTKDEQIEQLRVQLAGCGVAATGGGKNCYPGMYGWSASYGAVWALWEKYDKATTQLTIEKHFRNDAEQKLEAITNRLSELESKNFYDLGVRKVKEEIQALNNHIQNNFSL